MRWFLALIVCTIATQAMARGLDMRGCKKEERKEVHKAVRWLMDNLEGLDARLGTSTLMGWPENIRSKFRTRLAKNDFKVSCWRAPKCDKYAQDSLLNGAVGYPIFHRRRITLCPDRLPDTGAYATVIAHELGHLVYINADRKTCAERCSSPRFSHSLAIATQKTWTGEAFNGLSCLADCVTDEKVGGIDTGPSLETNAPSEVNVPTGTLPKALPR